MLKAILYIMFFHWWADFFCQTEWMAQNKSKRFLPLIIHALIYGAIMTFAIAWLDVRTMLILQWGLVNMLAHLITDGITSRITSFLWDQKQVRWFFVVIGFDQYIHFVTLLITAKIYFG